MPGHTDDGNDVSIGDAAEFVLLGLADVTWESMDDGKPVPRTANDVPIG